MSAEWVLFKNVPYWDGCFDFETQRCGFMRLFHCLFNQTLISSITSIHSGTFLCIPEIFNS